jgi:hypothetical protein
VKRGSFPLLLSRRPGEESTEAAAGGWGRPLVGELQEQQQEERCEVRRKVGDET